MTRHGLSMTEEQLDMFIRRGQKAQRAVQFAGRVRKNKYAAVEVIDQVEGRFASKKEYRCWCELKLREKAGEIIGLRHHVKFSLFDAGGSCRGEHIGTYTADFIYTVLGFPGLVVADAKSEPTRKRRDWARTKALMRACHGVEVVEL